MSENASKEYKKLLLKRKNFIRALTFHEPKVNELTVDATQVNVITRLAQIESSYEKYIQVTEELEASDEFEYVDLDPLNEVVVEKYIAMASKLHSLKKENMNSTGLNSTTLNATTLDRNNDSLNVKFPPLPIPTFNGNYDEWTTFHDNWKAIVDSQCHVPDVVKLHFLQSNLSGNALRVISNFQVTEANYKLAWDLLCDRFNNKRAITNSCLKKLLNQPQIILANAQVLRKLIDDTKEALQSIGKLNIDIASWDPIIVFIIQSKFDTQTLKAWEQHLHGSTDLPTVENMTDFLETEFRIHEITNMPWSIASRETQSFSNTSHHESKTQNKCMACDGKHWIAMCHTFDNWSIQVKRNFVNEKKLCPICLNQHSDPCRSKYRCQKCQGDHNTKLHRD